MMWGDSVCEYSSVMGFLFMMKIGTSAELDHNLSHPKIINLTKQRQSYDECCVNVKNLKTLLF